MHGVRHSCAGASIKCGIKTTINAMALSTHSSKETCFFQREIHKEPQQGDVLPELLSTRKKKLDINSFHDKKINDKIFKSVEIPIVLVAERVTAYM